jgi:virulence-associated protein VagC
MNVKVQQDLSHWYRVDNRDVDEKKYEDLATSVLLGMCHSFKHCIIEDSREQFQEINYRLGTASNVIKTYGFTGKPGSGWQLLQPRTRSWNAFFKSCAEVHPSGTGVDEIVIDFSFPEKVFKENDLRFSPQIETDNTFNESYPVGTEILEIVPRNSGKKWGTIMDRTKYKKANGLWTYMYDITFEKFGKLNPMNHEEISQLVVNAVNNKEDGIKKRKVRTASAPAGDTATNSHHGTSPQARMNTDILQSDDDHIYRPHNSPADPTMSSGQRIEQQLLLQQEELTLQPHPMQILEVRTYSPVKPPFRTTQRQLIRHNSTTTNVLASSGTTATSSFTGSQTGNGGSIVREDHPESTAFGNPTASSATTAMSCFTGGTRMNTDFLQSDDDQAYRPANSPAYTTVVNAVNNKEAGIKKCKVRTVSAPAGDTATTSHHGTSPQAGMNTDILRSDDDNINRPHDSPADATASSGQRIEQQLRQQQVELTLQPHPLSILKLFSPIEQRLTEPPSRTVHSRLNRQKSTTPTDLALGQRIASISTMTAISGLEAVQHQFPSSAATVVTGFTSCQTGNGEMSVRNDHPESTAMSHGEMTGFTSCQTGNGELTVLKDHPESTAMSHFTGNKIGDDDSNLRKDHPESTAFSNRTAVAWSIVRAQGKEIQKERKKIEYMKKNVPPTVKQHNELQISQTSVQPYHVPPQNPSDHLVHQTSVQPYHVPPQNPSDHLVHRTSVQPYHVPPQNPSDHLVHQTLVQPYHVPPQNPSDHLVHQTSIHQYDPAPSVVAVGFKVTQPMDAHQ